jgi:NAD(P)-dependent dehydrogenase (short-subunit alcohol dehydrogenase family)
VIRVDFQGAGVIVTGGTRGFGKAIGKEFARAGATVFLTHRWGSVEETELVREFQAEDLPAPHVIECDASDAEATRRLMGVVKERVGKLEVVVSNVAFAKVVHGLEDLKRSSLELSLGYSAWPVVDLIQACREVLGCFPRYVLGISSNGGEVCHPGYDFVGVSKAVLETLCRYLALRLKGEGVRVNAVRPSYLDTASLRVTFDAAFGDETYDRAHAELADLMLEARFLGQTCVALCSGLMDAVTGQVITVDGGVSLISPFTYITGHGWPAAFPAEGAGG